MQHIHAEFGFEIGFVLSKNSSVTLPYIGDKGALPWQPILGQNYYNCIKCTSTRDNENVITHNGFFVIDQSKEDISDWKGLRDVAMATKFWPK